MKNCVCGQEVRLRVVRISFNRKRGVAHWIEHADGSNVCLDGEWKCAAFKPYVKDESQREYAKLKTRWDYAVSA